MYTEYRAPLGANSVRENIWPRRLPKSIVTVLRDMCVISPALADLFWADLHPLLEAPCALWAAERWGGEMVIFESRNQLQSATLRKVTMLL